jgi:hypothetical protein
VVAAALTKKQQMEKHRANTACATCHAKMDPLGFALENYDAIGKWAQLPEFAHCVIEKMLIYALGRGLQTYDRKTVDGIGRKLAGQGYPFQSVIYEVVRSFPFQSRRGEATTAQNATQTKEKAIR